MPAGRTAREPERHGGGHARAHAGPHHQRDLGGLVVHRHRRRGARFRARARPRCQGNLAFTPIRALYFTAGILRSSGGGSGPQTLLNFGGGFSPFTGGQLLIRFGYDENVDTLSRVRNRFFGPSLRWNIRSGTYLDVVLHLERHLPAGTPDAVAKPLRQPVHQLPVTRTNPPTRGRDHA